MFRNHLKIALRNCWKYRTCTGINLAGFAIGLAACRILLLYAGHEPGYDRFHRNAGRIYRTACHASRPSLPLPSTLALLCCSGVRGGYAFATAGYKALSVANPADTLRAE